LGHHLRARLLRWGITSEQLEDGIDWLTPLLDSDWFSVSAIISRLIHDRPKFVVLASCEDPDSGQVSCGRLKFPEWVWKLILRVLGYQEVGVVEDWPERFVYYARTGLGVTIPPAVDDHALWLAHEALNLIEDRNMMDPADLSALYDEISDEMAR